MSGIHALACVDPSAELGEGTTVGPFAVIGPGVRIGRDNEIRANAVVQGPGTTIGDANVVYEGAIVGSEPQDKKHRGEATYLEIGSRNVFREHVTVHRGTHVAGGRTEIGDDNMFLVGSHIAHDCIVRNRVVLANNVLLAGHVLVEDAAIMNGAAAIHHFGTVGTMAYVGGLTRLVRDAAPFMVVEGHPARTVKVNSIGLERNGVPVERIKLLKQAFRHLFRRRHATWQHSFEAIDNEGLTSPEIERLRTHFEGIAAGRHGRAREALRD